MTTDEMRPLIERAKRGDQEALSVLCEENMGLCKSIANRFRDRGCEYDDLVQLGAIGLIKAIRSFDFSFGTCFSTYAVPLIVGEIRRFLRDDGVLKVGRGLKKTGRDILRKREEFLARYGREPRVSELCELCALSPEAMTDALDAVSHPRSLNEASGDDENGATLGDLLADREDKIGHLTDRLALTEIVSGLSDVERQILYLRYVKELSQAKVGEMLGMTQVKVSRTEKKIIERMRDAFGISTTA